MLPFLLEKKVNVTFNFFSKTWQKRVIGAAAQFSLTGHISQALESGWVGIQPVYLLRHCRT